VPGDVEQHVRSGLIISTIEETYASHRDVVALVLVFFIHKSGYPADQAAFPVPEDPTGGFSLPECLIVLRIKYFLNLLVDRPDISGYLPVQFYVHLDKLPGQSGAVNFCQLHTMAKIEEMDKLQPVNAIKMAKLFLTFPLSPYLCSQI
jgi:hypothetical protein